MAFRDAYKASLGHNLSSTTPSQIICWGTPVPVDNSGNFRARWRVDRHCHHRAVFLSCASLPASAERVSKRVAGSRIPTAKQPDFFNHSLNTLRVTYQLLTVRLAADSVIEKGSRIDAYAWFGV